MIVTVEGKPYNFPDDATDEEINEYFESEKPKKSKGITRDIKPSLEQRILEEKKATFNALPYEQQQAIGFGKTLASTPGLSQLLGLVTGRDMGEEFNEYNQASAESGHARGGEFVGDMATTLMPGMQASKFGKFANMTKNIPLQSMIKGAQGGLVSAGIHQGQNIQSGEGLNPLEASLEVGLSTAVPAVGGTMAHYFKKWAPGVLQSALKPPAKLNRQINKPQFKVALEEGLTTKFGGIEAFKKNVEKKVNEIGTIQKTILADADVSIDHSDVLAETEKLLKKQINYKGFGVDKYNEALQSSKSATDNALYEVGGEVDKPLILKGLDALKLKQSSGANGQFNIMTGQVKTPTEAKFWEAYTRALDSKIDEVISKTPQAKSYLSAKKTMAKIYPLKLSADNAINRMSNNYKFGLGDGMSTLAGSSMAGGGMPGVLASAGSFGAKRGLSTIGGADMMYNTGNFLGQQRPMMSQFTRILGNQINE